MRSTLTIGKAIYTILKPMKRVYALVAEEGTKFPFIRYARTNGYGNKTKDGTYSLTATVEITIAANNYDDSIEWAEQVLDLLESAHGEIAGFNIEDIYMIDSSEMYIENTFIQNMTFSVEFSISNKTL